jgi:hypothetical protein
MRNRWLVNLLLLILVIVLGTWMRRDLEEGRRVAILTGLLPESITEIAIERSGDPAIRLVQGESGWRMEAPYRVPADAEHIAKLARIASMPVYRSLPRGTDQEQLGLDPERVRLTLNGLVLRFGDLDPIAQHRYVAIADQVHLIGDALYYHLLASPEDYVDRRLLPEGFEAGAGTLDDKPLTSEQLAGLEGLSAEAVEPLGSELVGRLLSLTSADGVQSLRFLVSPDGLVWSRLDLRLRYRLATPPAWAVAEAAVGPEGDVSEKGNLDW